MICARASRAIASICVLRAWALLGKKPKNTKPESACSTAPLTLSKVVMLDTPGMGIARKPASRTAWVSTAPGSLTPGVPASLR